MFLLSNIITVVTPHLEQFILIHFFLQSDESLLELKIQELDKLLIMINLIMNIETNGSVVPEDSVAFAARIIDEQLKMFINFEEPIEEVSAPAVEEPTLKCKLVKKS